MCVLQSLRIFGATISSHPVSDFKWVTELSCLFQIFPGQNVWEIAICWFPSDIFNNFTLHSELFWMPKLCDETLQDVHLWFVHFDILIILSQWWDKINIKVQKSEGVKVQTHHQIKFENSISLHFWTLSLTFPTSAIFLILKVESYWTF